MKSLKQRFAIPVLFALATAIVSGCSSVPPPTVDDVIASNIAARGGLERIHGLQSMRASGTATENGGRVARIVREVKRPGLFRLEYTLQGTTSVFANDGTSGWQVAPLQGQFAPMLVPSESDAAGGADQRDIEGPLVDWKQKGHVVTLEGRETIDGHDVFKLRVAMKGGGVRYDYIDVVSGQDIRADVTRIVRGHATVLETRFSDFRTVDGLAFPFRIDTRVKDRPYVVTIKVDKVEINPALDDARFQMPR